VLRPWNQQDIPKNLRIHKHKNKSEEGKSSLPQKENNQIENF